MRGGCGGDECIFEDGRSLPFSAFSVGAFSRWLLIQGWALIRINVVNNWACSLMFCLTISASKTETGEYISSIGTVVVQQ